MLTSVTSPSLWNLPRCQGYLGTFPIHILWVFFAEGIDNEILGIDGRSMLTEFYMLRRSSNTTSRICPAALVAL
jgi:hypothetical protein